MKKPLYNELKYFKGILTVSKDDRDEDKQYISEDPDSLFCGVPNRILNFIDGCPSIISEVNISFDEELERLVICTSTGEKEKSRFTILITLEKIFRFFESEGIKRNEESLFTIRSRQALILRAISSHLKKSVQIMEYDPLLYEDTLMLSNNQEARQNRKSPM